MNPSVQELDRRVQEASSWVKPLTEEISRVVVGQQGLVRSLLIGLLGNGHVLLEGVPGLAKTLTVRTLSSCIHADFARIQFTPDLLPADLVGTLIYNPREGEFTTRKGPIFANLILADEINRAPAKVQSALLEAMQERQVTIGEETFQLPDPFLVLATQNPLEQEGTYPLPEAQLDRFFMKFTLGYPSMEEELRMLQLLEKQHPIDSLAPVVSIQELLEAQRLVKEVYVDPKVRQYMLQIVHETRGNENLALGGGPRATIALFRASQAMAAIRGRNFVQPDDVKRILSPVISHRLILRPESRLRRITADQVLDGIVAEIAVPTLEEPVR
jgi:MoxR-like ATPase